MAFLSWLANSEQEKQRALDFVALFDEPGTVDDLGVGVIRDAIADQLSPGTGTVQTRPRYFLFVPWIYAALERRKIASADIGRKARSQEVKIILSLSATDEDGVIGRLAGKELKRLPGAIYWSGLGTWGIRRYVGPQSRYHQSLDAYYDALRTPATESIEGPAIRVPANWDPSLPSPPDGFPGSIDTLDLTREEAEYLRDRIMSSHPGTMLAFLVDAATALEVRKDAVEQVRVFQQLERLAGLFVAQLDRPLLRGDRCLDSGLLEGFDLKQDVAQVVFDDARVHTELVGRLPDVRRTLPRQV